MTFPDAQMEKKLIACKLPVIHYNLQELNFCTISNHAETGLTNSFTNFPALACFARATSLQELPASNIALHAVMSLAGVVGFDLCGGRCAVELLLRVSHVAADPYTCDRCNMMQSFKLAFTNMFAHGLHAEW